MNTLLQIHARGCRDHRCPVINCLAMRSKFRELQRQAVQMDQRRRAAMNAALRGGGGGDLEAGRETGDHA